MDASGIRPKTRFAECWSEQYTLLSMCIGSYFAVRFAQVSISPVVPLLLESFTVSRGTIGLALTGMWVGYALAQLPSGVLADRFGERRLILAALVITVGATLGLAASPSVLLFGVAAAALGVGAGTYYNPATALLTREFDGIGGVIGTHRIGGQLAGVIAPVVTAAVAVRYGWRPALGLGASLSVVAAAFLWRRPSTAPSRPDASLRELFASKTLLELLARSHVRNTTFMMALVEFVGLAAMSFLPVLLVEHFELSLGRANLLFAVFFAVSAISQPLGGRLSDRIGRDTTIGILMTAGVLGYGALATGGTLAVAAPAVVLAGVATSATTVVQSRILDELSETNRGTGFGLFRTTYLLIGAAGTTVVGITADTAGWAAAAGLLAALLAAVLGFVLFARYAESAARR
ncbi:major facilitator superfamily MFS_1 [Natronococcus amylolyticus DSM 10524]|uniref:Major facilitator superfamily MFS_1 n=1 Tax=Natronococcus amylolyticus DSM 10524 TaxID=1227497 RepID=L9X147_9EURY|nr:MFS transporter [Natronococcus amylolyticus]ELY55445.1 major facilitator superfamily MFS_1 [Natronococcus amylolyticus DSM 10524]